MTFLRVLSILGTIGWLFTAVYGDHSPAARMGMLLLAALSLFNLVLLAETES